MPSRAARILLGIWAALVLLFLFGPIAVLIILMLLLGGAAGLFAALLLAVTVDRRRDRRVSRGADTSAEPIHTSSSGDPGPDFEGTSPRAHHREHASSRRAEVETPR